jgi:hypothetical protein
MTPTSPGLTPNTRTEAEAAFSYNAMVQTVSAAKPQATTPLTENLPSRPQLQTRTSYNYAYAATASNLSYEPPYPSDETAEAVRGNLSRGTTQAVLETIASGVAPKETLLSKRQNREGERRTSQIAAPRPQVQNRQSYNQQDMKRIMSEKFMENGVIQPAATGYNSVG